MEVEMRRSTSWIKAVVVSLALAATAATAMPAQAASFGFGFGFGIGDRDKEWAPFCVELTDYQIRKAVARQGFTNIYLNVRDHHRIQVRATEGKWVYLLRVSTCTGNILDSNRLRHS
jgi:hypothetical protein